MKTTSRRGSASSQPLPRAQLEETLDEARRIDALIADVVRRERQATAELAYLLLHAERCDVHRAFGHTRIGKYAVARGFVTSDRKARELIALAQELERLPRMRLDFRAGQVDWTKARTVAPVATPETEERWLDLAKTCTNRQLEVLVAEAKGQEAPVRRTFKQTKEQAGWLDEALRLARLNSDRPLTDEQALEVVCRGYAEGVASRAGEGPAYRIVIHKCECGAPATLRGRDGPVELSPASEAAAKRDAEVHDLRTGTGKVTKTIPDRIRRLVMDRDGGVCKVPGCGARGRLHIHHEPGREATGHDPDHMLLACDRHHPDRHEGYIEIKGDARVGFRFFLADGTELTGAPAPVAPVSRPAAPVESASTGVRRGAAQEEDEPARIAVLALVGLKCTKTEARELVRRAGQRLADRGEGRSVEALTAEALRIVGDGLIGRGVEQVESGSRSA
ncbi:MAG: HNH endonuclease [Planctomycetes bacterium]|nr:HNH endonuclease [Planctomycetota bacterium]